MHLRAQTLTDLSVVMVHYHTPGLAAEAVAALRREFDGSGLRAECVIVDNGSDAAGAEKLRELGVPISSTGRNRGYAGGVNHGVSRTGAPLVVAMNADVIVQRGSLAALCHELRTGAAAAGPRFWWDREGRLLLPPTERHDFASEALARLSARGSRWARLARQRWRRHARRHWMARESFVSYALSGALLAFRRDAWDSLGPFDERFRLYFEEADWLQRLAKRRWLARYTPAAQAIHLYNRSARNEPAAAEWFRASASRFDAKHFPRRSRWLQGMATLGRPDGVRHATKLESAMVDEEGVTLHLPIDGSSRERWIEISPGWTGYPAAAERIGVSPGAWRLPPDIWDGLAPGQYALRVVDGAGREHAAASFQR